MVFSTAGLFVIFKTTTSVESPAFQRDFPLHADSPFMASKLFILPLNRIFR